LWFDENLPPLGVLSQLLSEKLNFATNSYLASPFGLARPRQNFILQPIFKGAATAHHSHPIASQLLKISYFMGAYQPPRIQNKNILRIQLEYDIDESLSHENLCWYEKSCK